MPETLTDAIVHVLDEAKAQNITVLDVHLLTDITDTMVMATGGSNRQVKALADKVMEAAQKKGVRPLSCEGMDECEWVLVDLGNLLIHIMQPRIRDYYFLEGLWDPSRLKDGSTCP